MSDQGTSGTSSETANSGSADAGAAAAAAAAAAAGGAGGAAAPEPKFWEGFKDEKLRTDPTVQRYASTEELAKGLVDANARLGVPADQLLRVPQKPDAKDEWGAFFGKLGRPEKADGYKLEMKGATDADKEMLGRFQAHMHEHGAGLPQDLQAAVSFLEAETARSAEAQATERANRQAEVQRGLKSEWGSAYDGRMKEIGEFLNKVGGEDLAKELAATGMGDHPKLIRAIGEIVDRIREPGSPGGKPGDAAQASTMTPDQATAARRALEGDPTKGAALFDNAHPMHKSVREERDRLLAIEATRGR